MGNFLSMDTKNEVTKIPVLSADEGIVRETRNISGQIKAGYDLKTCEIADSRKLKFALFGTHLDPVSQLAIADQEIDALPFSAQAPARLNVMYPLLRQGKLLREITAVTLPGMTEGADFIVDMKRGMIRFIKPDTLPAVAIIPTVSCPVINDASPLQMKRLTPLKKATWHGFGRIYVIDQDEVQSTAIGHEDFECDISLSSPFNITGDAVAEMKLLVSIGEDVGEIIYRD